MGLLAVGTVAFDCVETPSGKRDDILGGSASYLATAASFFTDVNVVGVVGEDFPEEHLDFFRSRGIDTAGIKRQSGNTFRWRGRYSDDLNVAHTLETQLNVLEQFDPTLPAGYEDSEFVVLGNIDPELQLRVLKQVRNPKFIALDTMNFWIEGANAALKKTLEHIHLLSINDAEARQLSGEHNLAKAAKAIRAMGPRHVLIKRGEHGALAFTDEGTFCAPAMPLETIPDPTGAGDCFAGGLMGSLTRRGYVTEESLRQGVVFGSVMASFNIEDFSLERLRTLAPTEIEGRFQEFAALTHFHVLDVLTTKEQAKGGN